MNWLAHIFLSEAHIEYQHGNLLADLLKGRSWPGASQPFEAGTAMHTIIDRFTDAHPMVAKSKSRLGPRGRLRGVAIDIVYDHLLARHWSCYAHQPLDKFIDDFHRRSPSPLSGYPDPAQKLILRLISSGHLHDYKSFDGIPKAFRRIERRLSNRVLARERMMDYLSFIERELNGIERDFLAFMPLLIEHFKLQAQPLTVDHWFKEPLINS